MPHHLRTLDALHLAVLISLQDLAPVLVSADQKLLEAAKLERFAVLDPTSWRYTKTYESAIFGEQDFTEVGDVSEYSE